MDLEAVVKAAAATQAELPADEPEVVLRRTFDAPRDLVFAMWSDARELDQWWGPKGFSNTTHAFDFRVGGAWNYTMHGPDGTDYPNHITYVEIDPPERIVYDHGADPAAHPKGFHVTVTFSARGEQTDIVMRLRFPSLDEREEVAKFGAVQGGKETLARLALHLKARRGERA